MFTLLCKQVEEEASMRTEAWQPYISLNAPLNINLATQLNIENNDWRLLNKAKPKPNKPETTITHIFHPNLEKREMYLDRTGSLSQLLAGRMVH